MIMQGTSNNQLFDFKPMPDVILMHMLVEYTAGPKWGITPLLERARYEDSIPGKSFKKYVVHVRLQALKINRQSVHADIVGLDLLMTCCIALHSLSIPANLAETGRHGQKSVIESTWFFGQD